MTSTDPFTAERPFNTTLTDSCGDRWHFYYNGGTSIRAVSEPVSGVQPARPAGGRHRARGDRLTR